MSKLMKSLHLVKTAVGGVWAFRLMRDLVALGEEVHVAMPMNGPMVQMYQEHGIVVHELNYSLKHLRKNLKAFTRVVEEVQPDVIHSHFVVTTLVMRLARYRKRIPRVFQVPGPLHLEHGLFRRVDIYTANRKLDYWIPTCQWSYDVYRKCGIPAERMFLTYYGGDHTHQEFPKGRLHRELNLSQNDIVVGMVAFMYAPKRYLGQTRGLKGHEDLIDAVALIQDKYPKLHLVMVGGAWGGATEYEQRVMVYGRERCRNIHFLGTRHRDEVPELYQDFDMVVHPSHSENLGGAGQSLRQSVPTIATTVGGFPDVVIPGKTGYLVPPRNPQAIAAAIENIITHPEEAMELARAGRKYVETLLDSKNTSRAVHGFYRQMMAHCRQVNGIAPGA